MSNNKFEVSLVDADSPSRNVAVLRIASATRNSESQFYVRRIQVSKQNLESLHKKVIAKLALHQINDVNVALTIQLAKDRAITFTSLEQLLAYDVNVEALTELLTFKWSFVFSPERNGVEHLHSIYVRVSESPNPNLILQKMLSSQTEDIDSLERGAFAPVVCKIDFVDGRFSSEVLALVTEWVMACPVAEPTFRFFAKIERYEDRLFNLIYTTAPAVAVLAYVGYWLAYVSPEHAGSVRIAAAWVLGGGVVFVLSRYLAGIFNERISKNLSRICNVPVFQITAGDKNRLTKYLARSHKSMIKLCIAGVLYGAAKVTGLYMATWAFHALP